MAFLEWSNEFSVDVKEIDNQHKVLIEMINALHEAIVSKKGREIQKEIIEKMLNYANFHFKSEEHYMIEFVYDDYGSHKRSHSQFTEKAMELQERLDKIGFVFSIEIMNFLKDWLKTHILVVDKKYSRLFNENGLT